tara:strand:- start:6739 stop:7143 length:405 start_codon:yes stop_codon:yes gene_type:complete
MKKFKTLFIITLVIDALQFLPILLFKIMPELMDEAVYSQFPGINDPGKDALMTIFDVFGVIALSIFIAVIVAINIKNKEAARSAALILLIIHIGWTLMDCINLIIGKGGPPLPVVLLSILPIFILAYAWKKGEL